MVFISRLNVSFSARFTPTDVPSPDQAAYKLYWLLDAVLRAFSICLWVMTVMCTNWGSNGPILSLLVSIHVRIPIVLTHTLIRWRARTIQRKPRRRRSVDWRLWTTSTRDDCDSPKLHKLQGQGPEMNLKLIRAPHHQSDHIWPRFG